MHYYVSGLRLSYGTLDFRMSGTLGVEVHHDHCAFLRQRSPELLLGPVASGAVVPAAALLPDRRRQRRHHHHEERRSRPQQHSTKLVRAWMDLLSSVSHGIEAKLCATASNMT